MTSNDYNKHLSLPKRNLIEQGLNNNKSFKEIGELINKSPKTISYEIKKHRVLVKCNSYNNYKHVDCPKTNKVPYVCNGCESRKGCRKNRYYYYALDSYNEYKHNLSESRKGIDMTSEEFNLLNRIVSEEIKKGHSFSMICNNHKGEFEVGKRTLYNYVELGYLDIHNYNLPMKIRYKKRKKDLTKTTKDTKHRIGRTYEDFQKKLALRHYFNIVQMDTVEGVKGESVLLTLLYPYDSFMLAFKMEDKDSLSVTKIFDYLKDTLGYELFHKYFPIILTDNGKEFSNPEVIENNGLNVPKTRVYYCDPRRSDQKASLENNHRYIRKYIPKGVSFDEYSQNDITLMINHINSSSRDKLEGLTPYEVRKNYIRSDILKSLGLKEIKKTDVILNKSLFKKDTK